MPKGKKYTAAEKHFLEQKATLDKTIKFLRQEVQTITTDRNHFARRCEELEKENALLKQRCDELQKLHGLSDSDVRELIKKAESMNCVTGLFRMASTGHF